jgi:hypothetical protein
MFLILQLRAAMATLWIFVASDFALSLVEISSLLTDSCSQDSGFFGFWFFAMQSIVASLSFWLSGISRVGRLEFVANDSFCGTATQGFFGLVPRKAIDCRFH